jgi:hypothetical protein
MKSPATNRCLYLGGSLNDGKPRRSGFESRELIDAYRASRATFQLHDRQDWRRGWNLALSPEFSMNLPRPSAMPLYGPSLAVQGVIGLRV